MDLHHYVNADLVVARNLANQLLAMAVSSNDNTHLLRENTALGCTTRDEPEAVLSLQKALAVARYQRSPSSTNSSRLLLLRSAWFNEGFEISALRSARALLDELSKP